MSLDLGWVLIAAGIAGLVVLIYSLGVEVGRTRTGRKADMVHQRDRAMEALLRIHEKPYDYESDGL